MAVELDKFGSPLGSLEARVNEVLSQTPKTYSTLIDQAGIQEIIRLQIRNHLCQLVERGLILRSEHTLFSLPPEETGNKVG